MDDKKVLRSGRVMPLCIASLNIPEGYGRSVRKVPRSDKNSCFTYSMKLRFFSAFMASTDSAGNMMSGLVCVIIVKGPENCAKSQSRAASRRVIPNEPVEIPREVDFCNQSGIAASPDDRSKISCRGSQLGNYSVYEMIECIGRQYMQEQ